MTLQTTIRRKLRSVFNNFLKTAVTIFQKLKHTLHGIVVVVVDNTQNVGTTAMDVEGKEQDNHRIPVSTAVELYKDIGENMAKTRRENLMWEGVYALWWLSWLRRHKERRPLVINLSALLDHILATRLRREESRMGGGTPGVSEAEIAYAMTGALESGIAQMRIAGIPPLPQIAYVIDPAAAAAIQFTINATANPMYRPGLPKAPTPALTMVYERGTTGPRTYKQVCWHIPVDKVVPLHNENFQWVTSFISNVVPQVSTLKPQAKPQTTHSSV